MTLSPSPTLIQGIYGGAGPRWTLADDHEKAERARMFAAEGKLNTAWLEAGAVRDINVQGLLFEELRAIEWRALPARKGL